MGLFQGAVTNSSLCVLDGAEWYQCNAGYVNSNNGCVRTNATPSPILSPSVTPTPSPSSTLTYRLLGSPPFGQFCMPCTSGTECGYTLESCQARISAERGKQYCYTPPGCNLGILKDRCGVGEYTSPESCRLTSSAIAALPSPTPTPVPAQTYRIVGSPPFGQSCQLCANPAECGYSLASCESTIASMRGRVYCYTPPSCNIGILKDGCGSGETSDEGICRSMAQQSGVTTTGSTATGTGSLNGVTLVGD